MKLDFLKNPHQRVATGKSLPLRQVEAIVLYGSPAQRAKVVEKLLPSTYSLALNTQTYHILITLLRHTENLARVNMLYNVRNKILDLCMSSVGNIVVQEMIERVPARQRREIAQQFALNVEPDELRRLCEHPFGNHVAQKLLEYPECAEVVCPQGLVPHLKELASHAYGMRVVAKYVDSVKGGWKHALLALFPGTALDSIDAEDVSTDNLPELEDFLEEASSRAMDAGVAALFAGRAESMVVSALLKSLSVPSAFKDAIVAHLAEYAVEYLDPKRDTDPAKPTPVDDGNYAAPTFGTAASSPPSATTAADSADAPSLHHVHAFCSALEEGDTAQRRELWAAIAASDAVLGKLVTYLPASPVAVAAVRFVDESRETLYRALYHSAASGSGKASSKKVLTVVEAAEDPVRTLLLRAFIEVDYSRLTAQHRALLCKEAVRLSQSPTASPVLQKLLEADPKSEVAGRVYKVVESSLADLSVHPCACYFVQALLQFSDDVLRTELCARLWSILGADLQKTLAYPQGSRVMQKVLAYASDDVVISAVRQLVSRANAEAAEADEAAEAEGSEDDGGETAGDAKGDESVLSKPLSRKEQIAINRKKHYGIRSNAVADFALHNQACYVIQALLRETRSRQLEAERKALMNELKPYVFDLSVSPWAGRIVLDTMMVVGSAQLAEAMKNVVYLKAESWLSEVSDAKKQRGAGIDATTRDTLKRQRELNASGVAKSDLIGSVNVSKAEAMSAKKRARK